jgi:transcriptional regulator with XRE-family HTH domain
LKSRPRKQVQPASGPEKAFGEALREVRTTREISQEQLAFDSGFDRTYVSLMERGVRSPTIRSLVKLAEALKVRPSEIVARMESLLAKSKSYGKKAG